MSASVTTVTHPLAQVHLTAMRDVSTPSARFRWHLNRLAEILFLEATRTLGIEGVNVRTPLAETTGTRLARPIVLAPILRAGLGMVDAILPLVPEATVSHLGICRNEATAEPESYYNKLKTLSPDADVFLLDPMLATGGSACEAARQLKAAGATRLVLLGVVSCPAGLAALKAAHPDVSVVTAAIDERLDERCYIVPGLGDAGDRYFGT